MSERANYATAFPLTDEEHPLVKWALERRQALERCTKSAFSSPKMGFN
jgi:hypothetical protein